MKKQLSRHPNLQYYKKQAKKLLREFQSADIKAIQRMKESLPEWKNANEKTIRAGHVSLKDILRLLAFEHGFKSWSDMKIEIQNRRIIALPAFSTIAAGNCDSMQDSIGAYLVKQTMRWSEQLNDAEIVYERIRINESGNIDAIIRHASKSKIKEIEIEPNSAISAWKFNNVKAGDEFFLCKTACLSTRLESHKNSNIRAMAIQYSNDFKAGKATNQQVNYLLHAIEHLQTSLAA